MIVFVTPSAATAIDANATVLSMSSIRPKPC